MVMKTVEIRCPVGPRKLLSKLILEKQVPSVVDGNLLEMACYDCARTARIHNPDVLRVLHRYNLVGELIESVEVLRGDESGR
jgi:hypothetical protein